MATNNQPLALSGLASNMDTKTIVQQLMALERQPQDRLKVKQVTENARQQALKDVQTRLQTLSDAADALKDPALWANTQSLDVNDPTKLSATYVGGAGPGGYQVTVTQLARAEQHWYTYATPASNDSITVGGHSTAISAGSDINAAASAINSDAAATVYASVVTDAISSQQYLVLSSRQTGANQTFSATSSTLTEDGSRAAVGQDAQYSVNAVAKTSHSNVVTDGIPGLSLTLKGVTNPQQPVTVTVGAPASNEAAIADTVKTFVDTYNSTIAFIQSKVQEKPVAKPQTNADAGKGVLYADPGLESVLSSMRNAMSSKYAPGNPTTVDQMLEVGVSTGAAVGSGSLNQDAIAGKLSFDATAFAKAFASDPQSVKNLVGGSLSVHGFAQGFQDILNPVAQAGGTLEQRITSEGTTLKTIAARIAQMDDQLQLKQDHLTRQFTHMETALAKSQSEGQWLQGQLAGLQGGR